MNIFSDRLHQTGPKAHIQIETVIPHGKIGSTPQVFAYLVHPNGRALLVDEGEPIRKVAEAILSRKPALIPHVGFKISIETRGAWVLIGWNINGDTIKDTFAYNAETLLEQIAPDLVNKYLGLIK